MDVSENLDLQLPQVLNLFWGVVLPTQDHVDVRWSTSQKSWQVIRSPYRPYAFRYGPPPQPTEKAVTQLLELGTRFARGRSCRYCFLADPRMHGVAPDVFGNLRAYCLLLPSPSIVYSGTGRKKHAGEGMGCHAITPRWFTCESTGLRIASYGYTLRTDQVLAMSWCDRCLSIAASRSEPTSGSYSVLQEHLAPG